jgi:hypothetical protein
MEYGNWIQANREPSGRLHTGGWGGVGGEICPAMIIFMQFFPIIQNNN